MPYGSLIYGGQGYMNINVIGRPGSHEGLILGEGHVKVI